MLITTDGLYALRLDNHKNNGSGIIVYCSGDQGGATVQLQYINGQGDAIDLTDGLLEENTQTEIRTGIGLNGHVNITGATGATNIDLFTLPLK